MNKIEANLSYLASPVGSTGIEISDQKSKNSDLPPESSILLSRFATRRSFLSGILTAASVVPSAVFLNACGGEEEAVASPSGNGEARSELIKAELTATPQPPTAEATRVVTQAPRVIATEAPATPIAEKKPDIAWMNLLDVYMGETERGGKLILARINYKPDPSGDYVIFLGYNPGDQPHLEQAKKVSFKEQSFEGIPFTGKLEGPDVISGSVVFFNQSSDPVSYRVKKIGSGKDALVSAYLSIPNRLPQNTKEIALQRINLMCRDCLE